MQQIERKQAKNTKMLKHISLYFILFITSTGISAQSYTTYAAGDINPWNSCVQFPKEEIRAVWLATIMSLDWPKTKARDEKSIEKQKQELLVILNQLQAAHINTVILQTRIRGSVIYPSKIEPWDECLTGTPGKDPGYDPLHFAIRECHKRGMELHAWLVAIPLGDAKKQRGYGNSSVTKRFPAFCKAAGDNWFMRPDNPETGDYIAAICRELCQNYDIDGISLDYIRYPERNYNYTDNCSTSQRRTNITNIVKKIHNAVKTIKPWVKLSSSPIGKFKDLSRYSSKGWNSYDAVYQDAQGWLRDNIQDMLFPMMYFKGDNFFPFLYDWKEHQYGHPIAPGLGIYFLDPSEGNWTLNDVRPQIHAARNSGLGGVVFYRSDFFTRNCKGLYTQCQKEFFPTLSLPSRMTWSIDTISPTRPLDLYHDVEGGYLYWIGSDEQGERKLNLNDDDYVYYNIYGSDVYPVDTRSGRNLLKTRVTGSFLHMSPDISGYAYYAISASDRFGNESGATQEYMMEMKRDLRSVWNPRSRLLSGEEKADDRKTAPSESSSKSKNKKGRR